MDVHWREETDLRSKRLKELKQNVKSDVHVMFYGRMRAQWVEQGMLRLLAQPDICEIHQSGITIEI